MVIYSSFLYYIRSTGNLFWHMGAYAPATEKNILPCQKVRTKNWHLHLDVLCANDKFCEKPINFVACLKKEKNVSWKALFSKKIIIFTHNIKNLDFQWNDLGIIQNFLSKYFEVSMFSYNVFLKLHQAVDTTWQYLHE